MGLSPKSPSHQQTTIYSTMIEQHHDIDRLLGRLMQAMSRMAEPEERTATRRTLVRLRKTLHSHMELENEILFREFESQSGLTEEGPTATLRREHEVLRTRIDELLTEWKTASVPVLTRLLAAFGALYTDHCRREDVMYGICERLLSPELHAKVQLLLQPRSKSPASRSRRRTP